MQWEYKTPEGGGGKKGDMMGVNGNDSFAYALCSSVAAGYVMKRVVTRKTVQNSVQGAGPDQRFCVDSVIWLQTLFLFI